MCFDWCLRVLCPQFSSKQSRKSISRGQGQSEGEGDQGEGQYESCLLLGTWLLTSSEKMIEFFHTLGGVPEEKINAFVNERTVVRFAKIPGDIDGE